MPSKNATCVEREEKTILSNMLIDYLKTQSRNSWNWTII